MIFDDILMAGMAGEFISSLPAATPVFGAEGFRMGAGLAAMDEDDIPVPGRRSLPKGKLAIARFPDIDRTVYRVFTPLELSKILAALKWPRPRRKSFVDKIKAATHPCPVCGHVAAGHTCCPDAMTLDHVFAILSATGDQGFLLTHGSLFDWFIIPDHEEGMLGQTDRCALVALWFELFFGDVHSLRRHPGLLQGAGVPWLSGNTDQLETPTPAMAPDGFTRVGDTSFMWRWDRTDPYHRHGHAGWVLRLARMEPDRHSRDPHLYGRRASHPVRALSRPMATKIEAALDSGLFWYIDKFDGSKPWLHGWRAMIHDLSEQAGQIVDELPFEMMQAMALESPALWPEHQIRAYLEAKK